MPAPGPLSPRRLPEAVKRRLGVAGAMAWEALVEAHTRHALGFIALLADRLPFDEAVDRYLREMGITAPMAPAVRTRVLVALEDAERTDEPRPSLHLFEPEPGAAEKAPDQGWRRFRPDLVMRGVKTRQRRQAETGRWIELAIASAEESILETHVDNAITFVALLESHLPLARAIEQYSSTLDLAGARAQAVAQRTLARLAKARLPASGIPRKARP